MAIIKLTPSCKDYLWGGSRLRTDFGVQSDLDPLAEAWVLSCHPDGPSYLPDGTTLADYAAAHPEALGTDCAKFEQFPTLIKFIDAKNNLSIQAHPSNDYAVLTAGERLIYATHGHVYNTAHLPPLQPGDILLHGHTHVPAWQAFGEGNLYLNPGSVSIPKENSPHSYMTLEGGKLVWKDLEGKGYHELSL